MALTDELKTLDNKIKANQIQRQLKLLHYHLKN